MAEEYRLRNEEREAILNWTADDEEIHVTAEIAVFRRMLERRGWKADADGFFRIPVSALTIRSANRRKAVISDAERIRRKENMAKMRAGRVRGGSDAPPLPEPR